MLPLMPNTSRPFRTVLPWTGPRMTAEDRHRLAAAVARVQQLTTEFRSARTRLRLAVMTLEDLKRDAEGR